MVAAIPVNCRSISEELATHQRRHKKKKPPGCSQGRFQVPPEGLQQPKDSAGKTRKLTPEVAECAALSDSFESEQPGATVCKAMRVSAIDAWIANCPVVLPEAMTVGIRAMVQAVSVRQ
jgi:hypothetical protein